MNQGSYCTHWTVNALIWVFRYQTPIGGRIFQADPTHSSLPSAKNWCFHTGSAAFTSSTRR